MDIILLVASRDSYLKCLESENATKCRYAEERLPSTCNWLFDKKEYRDWLTADGPASLCISGVSGTGKSILSSMIIDHLLVEQQQNDVIAYCFLEEGLGSDDFAKHILEVLFRRLQEKDAVPEFLQYSLLPDIRNIGSPMSREEFQRFTRNLFRNIDCQTRVVLVLDGVDKDKWIKSVLVDEVIRINNSRHRSDLVRCLVSSRETLDCNTFRGQFKDVSLDNELGVQRDVLQFAESRLAVIYPTIAKVKLHLTSVAKRICQQGRGNFLWVGFVLENLQCVNSIAEVEKEVQSLPPTIDGLFQLTLQNIPTQETEVVRRALAWLLAASRPLELPELVEVLAIEPDPHRPPGIGSLPCRIWNLSPLIITTRENTVRFRHPSVRRHLLSADGTDTWRTSMVEAHNFLAQTCLMLMTPEKDKGSSLPSWSRKVECASSMKHYAFANWSFHYGLAQSHTNRLVGVLHDSLTITLHHDCEELSLPETGWLYQIESTILRIAAHYGFPSLTRMSLEMGANPNGSCDRCETPLALAAAGGHLKVVSTLIQRGASTAANDLSGGETALHLAAAYGSQETANMLLKNGARADSEIGYLSRTPLHAAASSGNVDILRMLMDLNVGLNAMIPISGETPLHLAASRGHLQAVQWLVEGLAQSDRETQLYDSMVRQHYYQSWTDDLLTNLTSTRRLSGKAEDISSARESMSELQSLCGRYADIDIRTREGRTALHLAASNGHVTTVRFLLETGAKINLADKNRYTALRLAAEHGHLNVVKLLLTAGADLDSYQLGATLKSITNNGHDTVANLLVFHFFSVEMMGKPCQWPVLALATKSKQNIVRDAIRKNHEM